MEQTLQRMIRYVMKEEARRDSAGRLAIYRLKPDDGGGTFEVSGINDKYHPHEAAELARLIRAGRQDEAERRAEFYIAGYTEAAARWTSDEPVEFYLRDCIFNRGARGAAIILQKALGLVGLHVAIDGMVGPATRAAIRSVGQRELLDAMPAAREWYEREKVGRDETSRYWKGLKERWRRIREKAREFEQ